MTIDEKLQHFYEVSLEEAREDAAQAIQEHKKLLSEKLEEHRQLSRQNAEAEVKAETEHVRREVNKALSAEQITLKRDWSKKQEELKEALFGEVSTKIRDFMSTSEYETYLCQKIKEAQDFAENDEIHIFLSSTDRERLDVLIQKTGISLQVSGEDFIGGIPVSYTHLCLITAVRTAGKDDSLRIHLFDLCKIGLVRINFAVYIAFSDTSCNKLIVLTTKINDNN